MERFCILYHLPEPATGLGGPTPRIDIPFSLIFMGLLFESGIADASR